MPKQTRRASADLPVSLPRRRRAAAHAEDKGGQNAHPDATLLALTSEFAELGATSDRLYEACSDIGDPRDAAWATYLTHVDQTRPRWRELLDAICATPALTREGLRAKAAAGSDWVHPDLGSDEPTDRLAWSVFQDVLGGRAAA